MEWPPWLAEIFDPLDLSSILRFPNNMPCEFSDDIPRFDGYDDSTMIHVALFMEFVLDYAIVMRM